MELLFSFKMSSTKFYISCNCWRQNLHCWSLLSRKVLSRNIKSEAVCIVLFTLLTLEPTYFKWQFLWHKMQVLEDSKNKPRWQDRNWLFWNVIKILTKLAQEFSNSIKSTCFKKSSFKNSEWNWFFIKAKKPLLSIKKKAEPCIFLLPLYSVIWTLKFCFWSQMADSTQNACLPLKFV